MEIGKYILEISYILASVLFVLGLKKLSHPETARSGNLWSAAGMVLAIVATIAFHTDSAGNGIKHIPLILLAIGIGTAVGWMIAVKVKMTAMPQLVSFFNGMGGATAALISLIELPHMAHLYNGNIPAGILIATSLGLVIGSVSFSGSIIAFFKLDGKIKDIHSPAMSFINLALLMAVVALTIYMVVAQPTSLLLYSLLVLSLLYGIMFVVPIGGADMPVVISLLNAFTGVAAAMGGFLYDNRAMLTGGVLVGSAGALLTILMCKAMNRSLLNVILGSFGGGGAASKDVTGSIKEISLSDSAVLLSYSHKVVIIPGYGLAVAQAQHLINELDKLLTEKGVEVKYAIHPVAGRMPGHMNVLLAEADVPYEKLIDLDEINAEMQNVDVTVVIGANDVVNPAALDDPGSPIYGMPIIRAIDSKNIIVVKRGMGKGYAAIENPLFYNDKTRMLFGDAKAVLQKLLGEVKEL